MTFFPRVAFFSRMIFFWFFGANIEQKSPAAPHQMIIMSYMENGILNNYGGLRDLLKNVEICRENRELE